MRRYELMLLFRPDLEDDRLQSAVEKVTRAIVNAGGALTKVSPWGKRRLAYPIQRFREASYFLLHFDIAPAQIRNLERGLLISEEILRHLVSVIEERSAMSEEELPPAAVPVTEQEAGEIEAMGPEVAEDEDLEAAPAAVADEDEDFAEEADEEEPSAQRVEA
ncbi:MAG TPA: 30S ribosomal protein S6 [Candidatus Limnocylindria bacterium]|nr:30S ribosomal protein S6 [Candidatus Limnocylindria bacterium]